MTTAAQVKKLVQPLLARNPDLALAGRLVLIKPVHHIVRGVYIDRSIAPEVFTPRWAAVFLFEPDAHFTFNWGGEIYKPSRGSWNIREEGAADVLASAIEQMPLPLLREVRTIDDFVRFASRDRFHDTFLESYELRNVFVEVARGNLAAAKSICENLATDDAKRRHLPMMREEYDIVTKSLCPLIAANDRVGLTSLLHRLELDGVKRMKLDKLWEPTPFPLERVA